MSAKGNGGGHAASSLKAALSTGNGGSGPLSDLSSAPYAYLLRHGVATRLENEEAADRGRGEAAGGGGLGVGCGRGGPNELGFGTKSKRGPRRGATPYCMAISRPLSRGILRTC